MKEEAAVEKEPAMLETQNTTNKLKINNEKKKIHYRGEGAHILFSYFFL